MASTFTSTFAPNEVQLIITQGKVSHIVSGFAEDAIITIERNSDTFDLYTGADDTNTRIYKANTSAKATIHLTQTSPSNDILSQLYLNDKAARNSNGMFQFTVKDTSGRSVFSSQEAFIAVVPHAEFGNSMKTRDWVIQMTRMDAYIGGNSRFSADDVATLTALGGNVQAQWQPPSN